MTTRTIPTHAKARRTRLDRLLLELGPRYALVVVPGKPMARWLRIPNPGGATAAR